MPIVQEKMNFEFADEITPDVIARALDVGKDSAKELHNGTIALLRGELEEIARFKGVKVESLRK